MCYCALTVSAVFTQLELTRAIVAKMGGIVVASLGEVTFHQTWLVLGWVICVRWHITFVYDQPI